MTERSGFRERRGHGRLIALADEWRDLAEDVTALADDHEQRYRRFTRDHIEPTYEDSYDGWLRRAAYIEARSAELLAHEVHLARLRRQVSWQQLSNSLLVPSRETVRTRYESFEKFEARRDAINVWSRSNVKAPVLKKGRRAGPEAGDS